MHDWMTKKAREGTVFTVNSRGPFSNACDQISLRTFAFLHQTNQPPPQRIRTESNDYAALPQTGYPVVGVAYFR